MPPYDNPADQIAAASSVLDSADTSDVYSTVSAINLAMSILPNFDDDSDTGGGDAGDGEGDGGDGGGDEGDGGGDGGLTTAEIAQANQVNSPDWRQSTSVHVQKIAQITLP